MSPQGSWTTPLVGVYSFQLSHSLDTTDAPCNGFADSLSPQQRPVQVEGNKSHKIVLYMLDVGLFIVGAVNRW